MAARSVLESAVGLFAGVGRGGAADGKRGSAAAPSHIVTGHKIPRLQRERGILLSGWGQNDASSSSMTSLSIVSNTARVLVSSGRKFFAKNDATAILPS